MSIFVDSIFRDPSVQTPWTSDINAAGYNLLGVGNIIIKGPSPYADIRAYGAHCDGITNDDAAIQAAVTAGAKIIFLPANTLWVPASNVVPGGVEYIGEDWLTDIVKSSNPDTNWITMHPGAVLRNVAIWDASGITQGLSPNAARPIRYTANDRQTTSSIPGTWSYQDIGISISETGLDEPGISVGNYGYGDAFFAGINGSSNGVGFRVDINSSTVGGKGLYVASMGSGGSGIRVDGIAGSSSNLVDLMAYADVPALNIAPQVNTTNDLIISSATKTSGYMLNFYHCTSAFSGDGLIMNFGNGEGSFTGNFLDFRRSGIKVFSVTANGNLVLGAISAPAYVFGGIYFDSTLGKLRIGGAAGWETVQSR